MTVCFPLIYLITFSADLISGLGIAHGLACYFGDNDAVPDGMCGKCTFCTTGAGVAFVPTAVTTVDPAQLKAILDGVGRQDLGVCLDTCHVYDGGYDIVGNLDGVLEEFDRAIGLNRLKALHLMHIDATTLRVLTSWLISSGLCTALRSLMVGASSQLGHDAAQTTGHCISQLLEACGSSLTTMQEIEDRIYVKGKLCRLNGEPADRIASSLGYPHINFAHNTELQSLKLCLFISFKPQPDAALSPAATDTMQWLSAADALQSDLSTVRSRKLEFITVHLSITLYGYLISQKSSASPQQFRASPSASALHGVMIRPYFDALKRVDVVLDIEYNNKPREVWEEYIPRVVEPLVCEMFEPWTERDIVRFTRTVRQW